MSVLAKLKDFRDSRKKNRFEKAAQLAKTIKAIKEDRWAALEYLNDHSDPAASVKALLQRFEFSLEHGINDTREKELVMKGIVARGKEALPLIKSWIQSTARIAWPIKILKELGSQEEVADALLSALNFTDVSFDQASVDKNYDILCYLRDFPVDPLASRLDHFLSDADERVRFACVEVLIERGAEDRVPKLLEPYLGDASAENTRIRQSVVRAFISRGWKVQTPEQWAAAAQTLGIHVQADGSIKAGV